jgi:LmbE family N-acetylglucosaminyl deacetylase
MDDAVLGCGGLISKISPTTDVHVVYATDGTESPKSTVKSHNARPNKLFEIRAQEAKDALEVLNVPKENLHFLGFPDGKLRKYSPEFSKLIVELVQRISPSYIFLPFRYDCHPDHLTVNREVRKSIKAHNIKTQLFEYFIYYRFRMLPKKDIRQYIKPHLLSEFVLNDTATVKMKALKCFKSQTSIFYEWQSSPILSEKILGEVCCGSELFLDCGHEFQDVDTVFLKHKMLIELAHFLEPKLKKLKDKTFGAIKYYS